MADLKVSALPVKTTPTTSDLAYIVDVADTTDGASGSSKQVTIASLPFVQKAGDTMTGPLVVNSASGSAVVIGPNGGTNPVLTVDASTASAATGIKIKGAAAAGGVAVSVTSSGTNENLTVDAKGSGTITIGGTSTGAITLGQATNISGATTITSNSSSSLVIGANGATNPVVKVDSSVASVATGLQIQGNAAGADIILSAISSGTNENLRLKAKGTSTSASQIIVQAGALMVKAPSGNWGGGDVATIYWGDTGRSITATNGSDTVFSTGDNLILQATGGGFTQQIRINPSRLLVYKSGTSTPAAGDANSGIVMGSANVGFYWGSGAPTLSAAQGSLYLRTDGSSTSTRLYVNTNGTTGWTNITSAT